MRSRAVWVFAAVWIMAVVAGLSERAIAVRPGTPLGEPEHIRVTYGNPEENDRFLAAIGEILG